MSHSSIRILIVGGLRGVAELLSYTPPPPPPQYPTWHASLFLPFNYYFYVCLIQQTMCKYFFFGDKFCPIPPHQDFNFFKYIWLVTQVGYIYKLPALEKERRRKKEEEEYYVCKRWNIFILSSLDEICVVLHSPSQHPQQWSCDTVVLGLLFWTRGKWW